MSKYFEALKPELEALEGQRQKTMATILIASALAVLVVMSLMSGLLSTARPSPVNFLVPLIWCSILVWFIHHHFSKKFGADFKARVLTKLVTMVDPSLQYNAAGGLDVTSFERSRLYPGSHTRFHAEDLVWGTVAETEFGFCELDVKRGSGKSEVKIFRGLFFEIALPAPMPTRVTMRPVSGMFENLSRSLEGRHAKLDGEPVTFDDPAFTAKFEVISQDPALAHRLLNAPLRKRLVALSEKAGHPVSVAFVDAKCYLGIPQTVDRFEPPIFSTLLDPAPIQDFLDTLRFVTDVVKDLNANAAARRASS